MNRFQTNKTNLPYLIKRLETALLTDEVLTVTWSKPKDIRVDAQNRLMWQFFTDFAAHCGYERKEVEMLKEMVTLEVWPKIVRLPDGREKAIPPSTSGMDTKEFSEMMDALIRYAAEMGFVWERKNDNH